jgi:hypothetical protein
MISAKMKYSVKPYDTMTEALDDLYKQGFTSDLNLITRGSFTNEGILPIQDFIIIRTIRFENYSDPAENAILYAITSHKHRIKGTLVNGFAIYSDPLTDLFINSIRLQRILV